MPYNKHTSRRSHGSSHGDSRGGLHTRHTPQEQSHSAKRTQVVYRSGSAGMTGNYYQQKIRDRQDRNSSSHNSHNRGGGRGGGRRPTKQLNPNLFINRHPAKNETEDYTPKHTFADFEIPTQLLNNIIAKGYRKPSPIQDKAIPVGLAGKDIIGIASTGTGKTAAFLIPLIASLFKDKNKKILIMCPTRELALQVRGEFLALATAMPLYAVGIVGGAPMERQIAALHSPHHAIIGTPGRIKDLMIRRKINISECSAVVLDEADRMLDMGFIADMRFILSKLPKERQGFFFSATFSPEIQKICSEFLNSPTSIEIKTRDTASSVLQDIRNTRNDTERMEQLLELLADTAHPKVLVFREMKHRADRLARELQDKGIKAYALHGDMSNSQRIRAVNALTQGTVQVVVATDVAARGIDIKNIDLVINYDEPGDYDTYVHRIGRTGRGVTLGKAITFVTPRE
ncbi:MAG: DEAD/DEAH box helicase [Alphaproteobacteria bacterium]|nr:DEAD/DEAH box helicase [Alphaproteobacteria bacterium]